MSSSISERIEDLRALRRLINVGDSKRHEGEIKNRKKLAWNAFHKFSHIFCNKEISLRKRLRLFEAYISLVILYGLALLPLTKSKILDFDIVQRKILRKIVRWSRDNGEAKKDTMVNMNAKLKKAMNIFSIPSWAACIFRNQ